MSSDVKSLIPSESISNLCPLVAVLISPPVMVEPVIVAEFNSDELIVDELIVPVKYALPVFEILTFAFPKS